MWLSYLFGFISYNILSILFLWLIKNKKTLVVSQCNIFNIACCLSFFIIGFLGYAITNDYYPYKENIQVILTTKDPFSSFESFWVWAIGYFKLSHHLYIFLLQGVSFTLFYWIVRLLRPANLIFFFGVWTILSLQSVIGGRSLLFYMLYYMAVVLMSKKKWFLSILFLFCCFFTHKTAYIAIPMFFLSMIRLTEKQIVLISATILVGALLIKTLILGNISIIYDYVSEVGVPGAIYLTHEENLQVTGHPIWSFLPIVSKFVLYFIVAMTLIRTIKYQNGASLEFKIQYRLLFWATIISTALLLIDLPDPAIATRVFAIGLLIALDYLISEAFICLKPRKYERLVLVILLFGCLLLNDIGVLRVSFINHVFD